MAQAARGLGRSDHLTNYFGPLNQIFYQLIQFDQINRPLYVADLVGQSVKVGKKTEISLKIQSYHKKY